LTLFGDALAAELRQVVREVVREEVEGAVRRALPSAGDAAADHYVGLRTAAEGLGVSTKTLTRMIAEGAPSLGSGRRRRVKVAEVVAWMRARSVGAEVVDLRARADELLARGRRAGGGR
jgi:excisionase family DNA binding protein